MSIQYISVERNIEVSLQIGRNLVGEYICPEQMRDMVQEGFRDSLDDNELYFDEDIQCWLDEYEVNVDQAERNLDLLLFMAVTDCPEHIMKQYM